ncbi:hypothetical protein B0H17DRAFT_1128625 [Mycena rosella]|uniref:Uncharacterized protein n=1 Tax=Mycena rosella TaxID=1033263 RepID=A0AAD7DWE6_MYCRO|nr:hypothetical protein B0H17DRAFT_1128625 [Mycena rosella]
MDLDAPPPPPRALSARQERRLIAFLDDKFLELTRGYKMRSQPSKTPLSTLSAFLAAATPLLALILQIPPACTLRTSYLLRLTHDVLSSVPGYPAPADSGGMTELLDWLDDLDQGWVCVLCARAWDPMDGAADPGPGAETAAGTATKGATQTERTRLRGLLVSGAAALEEWLGGAPRQHPGVIIEEDEDENPEDEGEDVADVLARLGVQDGFDALFYRTLEELGELSGVGVLPPT